MAQKPTVGIYSFAGCEGCALTILECEDQLLDLLALVDLVNFREGMDRRAASVDIAFVEGTLTTTADLERVQQIRRQAGLLVALGACAWPGGVNVLKNFKDQETVRRAVYGDKWERYDSVLARPLDAVVRVDYYLRGCPIDREEFLELTKALRLGREPAFPNHPVCVECKLADNPCRFDFGEMCLGPLTRAGCKAICPSFGASCGGCRGMVDEPEIAAYREVLDEHGVSTEDMMREYRLFGGWFWGGDLGVPRRNDEENESGRT